MIPRILLPAFFLLTIAFRQSSNTKIIPPGTVKINDTLFIDETEVTNIAWREYLSYLLDLNKDSLAFEKALPDTLVWNIGTWMPPADPLCEYYFRHPGFNTYPVVGISYEQAVDFCKWRTHASNQYLYFKENNITDVKSHLHDAFPIRYVFRLPSKEEWEMCAAEIDSTSRAFRHYHKGADWAYNTKERVDSLLGRRDPHTLIPTDVVIKQAKSFYVSKTGTYNMTGNVAEMISEKGSRKRRKFHSTFRQLQINFRSILFCSEKMAWIQMCGDYQKLILHRQKNLLCDQWLARLLLGHPPVPPLRGSSPPELNKSYNNAIPSGLLSDSGNEIIGPNPEGVTYIEL